MIELLDLQQTLHAFAACNDDDEVRDTFGWVMASDENLLEARLWLSSSTDEALDDDGERSAASAAMGLFPYLEPATFADVLDVQKRQRPLSSVQDYAQALAYYAEFDAFQQVDGIDEALGGDGRRPGSGAGGRRRRRHLRVLRPGAGRLSGAGSAAAQRVARLLEIPVGEALALPRVAIGAG